MKPIKKLKSIGKLDKVKDRQSQSIYVKAKDNSLAGYVDMSSGEKEVVNPSPLLGRLQPIQTPNQQYNENSAYTRYRKATRDVFLSKIVPSTEEGNELTRYNTFWFPSGNSNTGYWQVEMKLRTYYLKVKKRRIYLFGASNYQLKEWIEGLQENGDIELFNVEEDDVFQWDQIEGIKKVFLNGDTQTLISGLPRLVIPGTAGVETAVERSTPITLRIYPPDDPQLFDDLILWTTPTSFIEALALNSSYLDNRNLTTYYYYPFSDESEYPNGRYYKWAMGSTESILVTWGIPPALSENLVSITWLSWLMGSKVIYDEYLHESDDRLIWAEKAVHYYPVFTWDWFGDRETHESTPLFIPDARIDFGHDFIKQKNLYLASCINTFTEASLLFRRQTLDDQIQTLAIGISLNNLTEIFLSFKTLTYAEEKYITRLRTIVEGTNRTLIDNSNRTLVSPPSGNHSFSLSSVLNTYNELGVDFGIIG